MQKETTEALLVKRILHKQQLSLASDGFEWRMAAAKEWIAKEALSGSYGPAQMANIMVVTN